MSRTDGFLSRWSRRKLERPADPPEPLPAPAPASDATGPLPAEAPSEGEPVLSAEDLAALPRIEELTAESDLAPFLRTGVPALLRKAALRRMWSLDPAIRDFVGEARDYSYDWNVAGGVPVSGPLLAGDDAEATLRRMFSRLAADPEPGDDRDAADPADRTAPTQPPPDGVAPPDSENAPTAAALPVAVTAAADPALAGAAGTADAVVTLPAPPPAVPPARRHGAARPKFDSF